MSATAEALRRAQELARAAPVHVIAKQPAAAAVKIDIPESLKDCPHHLFSCVPLDKLVKQRQYFTQYPDWCSTPTPRHPNLHFDVVRPIPPGENGNTTDKVIEMILPPMMLNRFPFYLIGNSETVCDMTMIHPSISRVHMAVVYHQRGSVCICDLNSSNGVFLNDQKIAKASFVPVAEGDRIRLGASSRVLIVRLGENQNNNSSNDNHTGVPQQPQNQTNNNDAHQQQQQPQQQHHEPERRDRQEEEEEHRTHQESKQPENTDGPKEFSQVHLAHLLIKHKDLEKNKSAAPRNKGETITRSQKDAVELARAIRAQLATEPDNGHFLLLPSSSSSSSSSTSNRFILNNQKIFEEAVEKFSECGTAKKGGDMGVVAKGSLGNLPDFEAAALRLEPLEISSDVVVTHLGVHILFRVPDEEVDK